MNNTENPLTPTQRIARRVERVYRRLARCQIQQGAKRAVGTIVPAGDHRRNLAELEELLRALQPGWRP